MQEEKKPKFTSRPEPGRLFDPSDRWVLISVVVDYTGYTDDAVRAKIRKGDWPYRTFWRKAPDDRIVFNLSQIQRWMSCNVCVRPTHLAPDLNGWCARQRMVYAAIDSR